MSNLNEFQHFASVAQLRSFSEAAAQLRLPKSSVSRSISGLENRLGVQLLQRTTRNVRLTEAGKLYYTHCRRALEAAEAADQAIGNMQGSPSGTLRIATPISFARFIVEPLMGDFLARYPDLNVHIEVLNGIERRNFDDFDLVVRMGPLEDSEWLVRPLLEVPLGLFASPLLFGKRKRPKSPLDLQTMPCIVAKCSSLGDSGEYANWQLSHGSESREVRVLARVSVTDPAVHQQLAIKGVGLAMLSEQEAQPALASQQLERILPQWHPTPLRLFALHPTRLTSSPKVRIFLDHFATPTASHYRKVTADAGPAE